MKRMLFIFVLLSAFSKNPLLAQSPLPEYGVYSTYELNMKECSFDKDADAIILLDEANAYYDDDYHLITDRRIRIKILKQSGLDRGAIRIRYYAKHGFEFITKVEAMTYAPSGAVSNVDRKSFYNEKEDNRYSSIKFAMPNVQVGSIIEYKYESVMKHYGGLERWLFQSDLPTLRSCFLVQILPGIEFSYLLSKKSNYPAIIKPRPEEGRTYFEMNNIPGLNFEPFMDAVKDHLQRVEFQFSGYTNTFGDKQSVNTSWKELAYSLVTDDELGKTVKKSLPVPAELSAAVAGETTTIGKVTVIYNYVRDNFTWDGYYAVSAPDGLKKAWDKKAGTVGELNLILINLLQSFNIDATPMLAADRDYGKVDPASYPFVEKFDKTVAYVVADGRTLILDASQKYGPATLIPHTLLNTYTLLIDKKTEKLTQLTGNNESYKSRSSMLVTLDKQGQLKGTCITRADEYAKESQIEKIRNNLKGFIGSTFQEPYEGLKVDSFAYEYSPIDTASLVEHINFSNHLDETGGFFLLNYNLFTRLAKNPFKADERFTNISFEYPYHVVVEESIELPPGSKTDDLLKSKTLQTPDRDIVVSREIKRTDNTLSIKIIFNQTVTSIDRDSYAGLKNFYKSVVDMLNEPIVIKL